jgi:molecular chaperone GrpE
MIDEEHRKEGMQGSTSVDSGDAEDLQGAQATQESGLSDAQTSSSSQNSSESSGPTLDELPLSQIEDLGNEPNGAEQQMKLAALEGEIQLLKSQLEDRAGQYMRIAADFDNYRKRTQREKEEMDQQIKCATIKELLPVVDNFERARSQIKPQTDQETAIHKSYQGVYKQLVDCLKQIGVSPMRVEGAEFDPNLHEAVMRQPTDEYPDGVVMEELQRGYMLGERVLRHALVKVAAAPDPVITSEEND